MNISLNILVVIFISSGIGGVARYLVQAAMSKLAPGSFPVGTLMVNIAGCLLIGVFFALGGKNNLLSTEWRIALTTGFCGGFTTFSAFAYENMHLLKNGQYLYFTLYTGASIILGIAAVFLGMALLRQH